MALRYVLPQRAAFADAGAWADVDPVPDAGICADLRTIVDDGGFVGVELMVQYSSGKATQRLSQPGPLRP